MGKGTILYLPIPVDGALLSAGDGHARQGDGEVSQVATPRRTRACQLLVDLRITQIVNGVKGVHALLRDDAIR